MYSFLLAIIYISFISLGLPDSLLGSAWPVLHRDLNVPLSFAGIISMIIAIGTIVSSLMSDRLTKKFGSGLVTAVSVLSTAVALFGFSFSRSFIWLCFWAIPYGLGAGGVDASLNNYVALHYAARHMSWLHCCWGVGASISPYIMGYCLTQGLGWSRGYSSVGIIQITLAAFLFFTLPMWKKRTNGNGKGKESDKPLGLMYCLKIKGVIIVLISFFAYCALEHTAGLWASSYLVQFRNVDPKIAARFASLFFLGITFGRFLSGFISEKFGDRKMIRYGIIIIFIGLAMVVMPLKINVVALIGLVIIGLGCAPIYPAIIHSTPFNFGEENSQAIIGIQMASAYVGSTVAPPVFGVIADFISIGLYPVYLFAFCVLMLVMTERLPKVLAKK